MTLTWLLLPGLLTAAEPDKPAAVRYLRPDGDKFALESEVTRTTTDDGAVYVSRTDRGTQKMTLTLRYDKDGRLTSAEAVLETARDKRTATVTLRGTEGRLQRGGTTEAFTAAADPVVTTAPDWSDIFQLVRRYDARRGGRQEFPGLWFHPTQALLTPTFAIERIGSDDVVVQNRKVALTRYQVRLRNNAGYLVWADPDGRVCKILPRAAGATPVLLEGYEEATRTLK